MRSRPRAERVEIEGEQIGGGGKERRRGKPPDEPADDPLQIGSVQRYSRPVRASSLSSWCIASMRRTVPERERMTMESVEAPFGV